MKKIIKKSMIFITLLIIASCSFLFTACTEDKGRVVEEDTVFLIDRQESSIKGMPFNLITSKTSNITLRKDGTATLQINLMDGIGGMLDYLLPEGALDNVYLDPIFFGMAEEYFPGFSVYDLEGTFANLESAIGLKLIGLDYNDPDIQEIFISLGETGRFPAEMTFPDTLALEYNANYYIKDVHSKYSGKYTGVFMGEHHEDGEPFVIMDYTENPENGKGQLTWKNDIIDLRIYATQA